LIKKCDHSGSEEESRPLLPGKLVAPGEVAQVARDAYPVVKTVEFDVGGPEVVDLAPGVTFQYAEDSDVGREIEDLPLLHAPRADRR
jgi:hypothetical protein